MKPVLALLAVLAAAATALGADGGAAPGITPQEKEALAGAAEFAGLSLDDLKFRKSVAGSRMPIGAVNDALADPIEGVRIADALSAALSKSDLPGCMGTLGSAIDPVIKAAPIMEPSAPPAAGSDREAFRAWLSPLAPDEGFDEEDLDAVAGLPEPVLRMLGWFAALLPAADSELSSAFKGLSEEDAELLRQFGLMLSIADDEVRDKFMPPDPVKATGLLASKNGAPAMAAMLDAASWVDVGAIARAGSLMALLADRVRAALDGAQTSGFGDAPGPAFELETRFGTLRVAGKRNDVHEQGPAFLVDLGGDDVYRGAGFGAASALSDRRLSLLVDMDGDDVYISNGRVQLGAAFMGAAGLYDCRGDDSYRAVDICLGASILGSAFLVDAQGSDSFLGREFCQAAAAFGTALVLSDAAGGRGNDSYRAEVFSQGLARTMAAAALVDRAGHDCYTAGAGRLYLPQSKVRHYSHSQGFAIGVREFAAGGGVALLLDCAGNDDYRAEIHAQGSACWMGLGMLCDLAGDDRYACTFNGQGAAVHQSVGILVDASGDDSYTVDDGIGQGAAHDFACGILCDRGGNDKYAGRAAVQGVGLTNGVGILIDRNGDDLYAAHSGHYQGAARGTRNYRSVGILVDLAGRDTYTAAPESLRSDARADSRGWTAGSAGAGIDAAGKTSPPDPEPFKGLPEGYEFTREKFDELFATASLWVVGDNIGKTASAKAELACWGARALPFLRAEMKKWGTLHFWALDAVVLAVHAAAPEETAAMVLGCFNGGDSVSQANALRLCGKLKIAAAAPVIVSLLGNEHWATWAIWPAGQLKIAEAAPVLMGILAKRPGSADSTEAVVALCKIADPSSLEAVLAVVRASDFAAREAAVANLWRFAEPALTALVQAAADPSAPRVLRVAATRALARFPAAARGAGCDALALELLRDPDWAVRAAAAMLAATGPKAGEAALELAGAMGRETHPYARTAMARASRMAAGESQGYREPVSGVVEYPLLLEDD